MAAHDFCNDSGTAELRVEAAMEAFKGQWLERRGWEHPWIRRPWCDQLASARGVFRDSRPTGRGATNPCTSLGSRLGDLRVYCGGLSKK